MNTKYYIKSAGDLTAARRKAICEGLAMNKNVFGTSRTTYKVVEYLDASQSDSGFHDSGYCKLEVSYRDDGKLKTDIEIIMYSTSPINRNSFFDAAVTEKFESAIKARDNANDEAIKSFVESLPSGMGAVVPTVATESVVAVTTDSEPPVDKELTSRVKVYSGKLGFVCYEDELVATYSDKLYVLILNIHTPTGSNKLAATLDWGNQERFVCSGSPDKILSWLEKNGWLNRLEYVTGKDILNLPSQT
jgi:hypothetical protein